MPLLRITYQKRGAFGRTEGSPRARHHASAGDGRGRPRHAGGTSNGLCVEGASTQAEKLVVHGEMNRIVANIVGVDGTFPNRATDWVIINDVPEGAWGASGQTVGVRVAIEVLGGAPERAGYFDRLLAAKRRLSEAHGFPSERS